MMLLGGGKGVQNKNDDVILEYVCDKYVFMYLDVIIEKKVHINCNSYINHFK